MTQTAEVYQFRPSDSQETFEDYWQYCQEVGAFQSRKEARERFSLNPEQYFKDCGWVYVLSNPLMPARVFKIGRTTGRIERRMRQLYTTGVPMEFECLHASWFADCITAEKHIHRLLSEFRLNESREFFMADFERIRHAVMEVLTLGEMHPDHMIDIACARYEYAAKHERVNGHLVIPERNPVDDMEIPF
ncbi:MAG: GIY-YIG nuclease family protein [Pseudomonadota bacterium]|nr:GIY-YIG nuclease family protein [Pseudomonadota bacterium]